MEVGTEWQRAQRLLQRPRLLCARIAESHSNDFPPRRRITVRRVVGGHRAWPGASQRIVPAADAAGGGFLETAGAGYPGIRASSGNEADVRRRCGYTWAAGFAVAGLRKIG